MYNRPAEIWAYDTQRGARKLRTFHEATGRQSAQLPLRLSYYGGGHYDSIVDSKHCDQLLLSAPGVAETLALNRVTERVAIALASSTIPLENVIRQSDTQATEQEQAALDLAVQMSQNDTRFDWQDDLETCLSMSLEESYSKKNKSWGSEGRDGGRVMINDRLDGKNNSSRDMHGQSQGQGQGQSNIGHIGSLGYVGQGQIESEINNTNTLGNTNTMGNTDINIGTNIDTDVDTDADAALIAMQGDILRTVAAESEREYLERAMLISLSDETQSVEEELMRQVRLESLLEAERIVARSFGDLYDVSLPEQNTYTNTGTGSGVGSGLGSGSGLGLGRALDRVPDMTGSDRGTGLGQGVGQGQGLGQGPGQSADVQSHKGVEFNEQIPFQAPVSLTNNHNTSHNTDVDVDVDMDLILKLSELSEDEALQLALTESAAAVSSYTESYPPSSYTESYPPSSYTESYRYNDSSVNPVGRARQGARTRQRNENDPLILGPVSAVPLSVSSSSSLPLTRSSESDTNILQGVMRRYMESEASRTSTYIAQSGSSSSSIGGRQSEYALPTSTGVSTGASTGVSTGGGGGVSGGNIQTETDAVDEEEEEERELQRAIAESLR